MFRKVSVLLPTRKRPAFLRKMLRSYDATVGDASTAEIVFRADSDDTETIDFLRQLPHRFIVGPRVEGYKSLPAFFNEMAGVASGDLLMCCNDDVEFRTPDWPRRLCEAADRYPDGIFNFGVNVGLNDDKFPFSIVSRRLVQALGFINDERLLFSDIFLLDVARHFNRAIRLDTVTIFHDWAGHGDDETRREANRHEFGVVFKDATGAWSDTYREAHDNAVREAVQRITQTGGPMAETAVRTVEGYEPPGRFDPARWPPQTGCRPWKSLPGRDGMPYARSEAVQVLDVIYRHGVNAGQAVVTSFGNGLPSLLWAQAFPAVISLHHGRPAEAEASRDGHLILTGDSGDTRFLLSVLERVHDLHALVIDDIRYASAMSAYYLIGEQLKRPGIVVFTPMSAQRAENGGARRLVDDLRSGAADNRRHVITDVTAEAGGPGMSYELRL